jgi:ankyrin repeat protein
MPLHIACGTKAPLKRIQYLVEQSPDSLKRSTDEGMVALHVACQVKASFKTISFLVDSWKKGVQQASFDGRLPLHVACEKQLNLESIQYLLRAWPESISQKDNMGQTPLDKAKMTTSSSSLTDRNPDDEGIRWLEEVMEKGALLSSKGALSAMEDD